MATISREESARRMEALRDAAPLPNTTTTRIEVHDVNIDVSLR